MNAGDQARIFLAMLLCGACVGALHDLLALFRRSVVLAAAADILLGILLAAGMIAMGIRLGCDPFRLYAFAGVFLGWAAYVVSLGTIVRVLIKSFTKLSKKVTN